METTNRKSISETSANVVSSLKELSSKERDVLVRKLLIWSRSLKNGKNLEKAALALDELCYSIDGNL